MGARTTQSWTRREFAKAASLGLVGGLMTLRGRQGWAQMRGGGGGGMGGGGMGGGGGSTVIDPPVGGAFSDPVPLPLTTSWEGGRRVVAGTLEARQASVNVNGTSARLLTYNGCYPGPAIRVKRGDLLRIRHANSLPAAGTNILGHQRNIVNLHTHGLHVSPMGNSDNMMVQIPRGGAFDYEFDLANQYPGSLNFYHPHVHGTVAEEYWGGLVGPLVVEDEVTALSSYEPHVLVLKDLALSGSDPVPHASQMDYMHGVEGNLVMVNGVVNPRLTIAKGQVQRWQIVNASNARFYWLGLDRHTLHVVGTDGGLLDRPYPVSRLLLSPGERVDVLVKADQAKGSYKLLSYPYGRGGMSALQTVTLMTVTYQGSASDPLPASVDPGTARLQLDVASLPQRQITLGMMQGRGYINGVSFVDMDQAAKIVSHLGTYEVWEVVNQSGMDHPFHQHVNACQVLAISGGDPAYASLYTTTPARKDVVIVPKWGSATLLVPVEDYAGMTMFHCHILEHEDIGMMGVWDIMEPMGG